MKLSTAARVLANTLVIYIVLDILLTPLGRLETRPVADVTSVGFATLGLLFAGLVLGILSVILLFRRSRRSAIVAIVAAVLYFPAALADQTGLFSSLRPPTAIANLELAQAVVAVLAIGFGFWALRTGIGETTYRDSE